MSRTFAARYPGWCGCGCHQRFDPGDEIAYDDEGLIVRAGCAEEDYVSGRPIKTCPTCWLTLPCDCEVA